MRMRVQSLASLSGLRIWHYHELWCRLAATASIRTLDWELTNTAGASLKSKIIITIIIIIVIIKLLRNPVFCKVEQK